VTTIDTTQGVATPPAAAAQTPARNELGQDAFMQLLITQLEHQDPTAPKDDSQLIAQLAQFSSLEKLTSIDQAIKQMNDLFSALLGPSAPATNASATTLQKGQV
jgi:flagellar basal-body rod modification protein FlgD